MVLKGELDTYDPIEEYLPSHIHVPTYDDVHISLGNLSDHTSSLPRLPDNFAPADPNNPYADYTVDHMYSFLSSYKLTRPIGSEYEYSNLGVGLLGHILALKAGKSYEELMISTIASPLNMHETKVKLSKKMKKNLAIGHADGSPVSNWDLPSFAGAVDIRSSVYDMLIFLSANLGFFDHPLKKAMLLTHIPRHNKAGFSRVGLGWHMIKSVNGDIFSHNGGTGGYSTFAGFIKETERGVVVLTNSTEDADDIGLHLLDPTLPLKNVIPHIAIKLKEVIDNKGHVDLLSQFDKLKKVSPEKYDYSESGINSLGYYYLNRKNFDEAIAVFLLNIREYPQSFNVYDSYGEALMEKGEKDLAIWNYKKSLEMNPGNWNAVEMLDKMGVKVELPNVLVDESILETYVGVYELVPGFEIAITKDGTRLMSQASGQGAYEIFPKSSTEFYFKVVDAQITFNKDREGKTESLTLHQGGRDIVGKKTK